MAETVGFVFGLAPVAIQLYNELDDYLEGLKERNADVEIARVQRDVFKNWLGYINNHIIAKVPLDTETQGAIHRISVVIRNRMEKLEKFIKSLKLDASTDKSQRAAYKQQARGLLYPLHRSKLKELQKDLEALNDILDGALKPVLLQIQAQSNQDTGAGIARITSLIERLEIRVERAFPGDTPISEPGTSRVLTPEEAECLQTFRITEGDRDTSYEWYKDLVDERVKDTCQWFLGHENYQTWLDQRAGPLLVTADPGCGKSVLAKYLIDHGLPRDATICYYFFKDQDQNRISQAFCAMLHQLLYARPDLIRHARAAKERNGSRLVRITAELRDIFDAVIRDSKIGKVIFVFDALDECYPADLKVLVEVLNNAFLEAPAAFQVKCLMTSRPYEQVSRELHDLTDKFPHIRIPGEQESDVIRMEVEQVIQVRVKTLAKKKRLSSNLEAYLVSRLLEVPHRTYLWVYLVFEYLENLAFKRTERGLETVLQSLPSSVNEAYEKILARSREDDFVRKALSLIITAVTPLDISELNIAIHADGDDTSGLNMDLEEDDDFESRLRECCGLFLIINHGKVYLIHQTAREFLLGQRSPLKSWTSNVDTGTADDRHAKPREWRGSLLLEDAELAMAQACVFYLRNLDPQTFGLETVSTNEEVEKLCRVHSENLNFLRYSVRHWEYHVRMAQKSPRFSSLIEAFGFEAGADTYWRLARFLRTSVRMQYHDQAYASARYQLHLAAALDHVNIAEFLINRGASVDPARDDHLDPPLRHASLAGSYDVVRCLLNRGADVDGVATRSVLRRTALFPTTSWVTDEIVDFLLMFGANPRYRDRNGQTPLFFATSERMVQQLLDAGADVDAVDLEGSTPLFMAIAVNSLSIISVLLQHGADPNSRTTQGSTPLFEAIKSEWWDGVGILLRHGGDVNAKGPDGKRTIWSFMAGKFLQRPSGKEDLPVLGYLLPLIQERLRVDTDTVTTTTPLHIAAYHDLQDSVEVLIEAGAYIDARNEESATPLIVAALAQPNQTAMLRLLLKAGADPNGTSNTLTPLLAAVHREWEDGVRILLEAGADPNVGSEWVGSPAIHTAAAFGLDAILRILIDFGADVNATDRDGTSALCRALEWGEDNIADQLRAAGAK